mmetsp:Transcript_2842/g.8517  ORF Transcript_2842/g.8517 Transcript_2842/m.8517 type:complete len:430 (+) Transcript_2842:1640-2929(+)
MRRSPTTISVASHCGISMTSRLTIAEQNGRANTPQGRRTIPIASTTTRHQRRLPSLRLSGPQTARTLKLMDALVARTTRGASISGAVRSPHLRKQLPSTPRPIFEARAGLMFSRVHLKRVNVSATSVNLDVLCDTFCSKAHVPLTRFGPMPLTEARVWPAMPRETLHAPLRQVKELVVFRRSGDAFEAKVLRKVVGTPRSWIWNKFVICPLAVFNVTIGERHLAMAVAAVLLERANVRDTVGPRFSPLAVHQAGTPASGTYPPVSVRKRPLTIPLTVFEVSPILVTVGVRHDSWTMPPTIFVAALIDGSIGIPLHYVADELVPLALALAHSAVRQCHDPRARSLPAIVRAVKALSVGPRVAPFTVHCSLHKAPFVELPVGPCEAAYAMHSTVLEKALILFTAGQLHNSSPVHCAIGKHAFVSANGSPCV